MNLDLKILFRYGHSRILELSFFGYLSSALLHFCVLRRCFVLAGALSKPLDLNTQLSSLVVVACFSMGCRVISAIYLNPKFLTKHLNQNVLTEHLLRHCTS